MSQHYKFSERFCMNCSTFTVHYGVRLPVFCSVCKPIESEDKLERVDVTSDVELKEIVVSVDRRSFALSLAQADSLAVKLSQVLQDKQIIKNG